MKEIENLSTEELANSVCDIMENNYGEHNYKAFLEVVNRRLKQLVIDYNNDTKRKS